MKAALRIAVASIALSFGITTAHVAMAAPPPETLTLRDLVRQPLRWPDTVKLKESIQFGGGQSLKAGEPYKLHEFDGREIQLLHDQTLYPIKPEQSDFLESANALWATYTPEQRALDLPMILKDASLWPEKVTMFPGATTAEGKDIPANAEYRVISFTQEEFLLYHDETKTMVIANNVSDTDMIKRARDIVKIAPADRPSRLVNAIKGKSVDVTGKPDGATLDDTQFFVMFYGANWCGWCHKMSPSIVEAVKKLAPNTTPAMTTLLMSGDDEQNEMLAYMKKGDMPFSAIPKEAWKENPVTAGLAGSGFPTLVITDRYGKVIYKQSGGGPQQINAGVAAINRAARSIAVK